MGTVYSFGPYRLDTDARVLLRGSDVTSLGTRAVLLLLALLRRKGDVVSKRTLMETVWPDVVVEECNLPVQIAALRHLFSAEDGGDRWIETVPRRGYRFVGPAAVLESLSQSPDNHPAWDTAGLEDDSARLVRPSIAVLAFENLSGSADREYFGDAVANDIIAGLTRFRWFAVAARHSSFTFKGSHAEAGDIARRLGVRYVLEGSHHQSGDRIRITARLIDAKVGQHIWAERYERDIADIFAIQDEIADRVAGAIEPELLRREASQSTSPSAVEPAAHELIRKGIWLFHQVSRETHEQARELFKLATVRAPQAPEPHIWLARVSGGIALWGWSDNVSLLLDEGRAAALAAIHLDNRNPYAHYALAIVSCPGGQLEQATRAAERAVALSPSFALGYLVMGMAKLFAGLAGEAKEALQRGLRLSAYDPHGFVWFSLLALAHLFEDDMDEALAAATEALKIRPAALLAADTAAICLVAGGRADEARVLLQSRQSVARMPNHVLAVMMDRNPVWRERIVGLLKLAEGPE